MRYPKPRKFPRWSKVNGRSGDSGRYAPEGEGIAAMFHDSSKLPHANHIEMSGFQVSTILSYRIDARRHPTFYRFCVFPSLRILPNDTRGSLSYVFPGVTLRAGRERERITRVFFNGILQFDSMLGEVRVSRRFLPCRDRRALVEELVLHAGRETKLTLFCKEAEGLVEGRYTAGGDEYALSTAVYFENRVFSPHRDTVLISGEATVYIVYGAERLTLDEIRQQIAAREQFLSDSKKRLDIRTPDDALNRMLAFTKVRASESIFQTKNGLMHAPGGGQYYAALWTNDQCEYANPLFAYLGYDRAQEQSLNCYRLYSRLASESRAVDTSIVAEGDGYWNGAGDRGDSSMYVYGFARYLLTTGDRAAALEYLPALERACTYIQSKMNDEGVIESDSDELENRFESGQANLSTAVISCDAFRSMAYLENELGNFEKGAEYARFSEKIRSGIHSYFEAEVEGFSTYRYCREETRLRSWICLPLTIGIDERLDGTARALQSCQLRKPCGLLTRSGGKTFWDRSLLYALRGLFYAGRADEALAMLTEYTNTRLYGEHVPYPVEAFPEGNAAHLAAESALYVRIFTEGVMGFRPLSFQSFELRPNLPGEWDQVSVKNFCYAGRPLTILMRRSGDRIAVSVPEAEFCAEVEGNTAVVIALPPVPFRIR